MEATVVAGPGNGREMVESLAGLVGLPVRAARPGDDLTNVDLLLTPRGPSRSFSAFYRDDPLGQAVLRAYNEGIPWIALCGSALPLSAAFGPGCDGVHAFSLVAMKGTNDRLHGQGDIKIGERRLPFHFTSAPSYQPLEGTEVLGTTNGEGSLLRAEDLVVCSGLPMTRDGWEFLFEAVGCPLPGARLR